MAAQTQAIFVNWGAVVTEKVPGGFSKCGKPVLRGTLQRLSNLLIEYS